VADPELQVISNKLERIGADVKEVRDQLRTLNGTVRDNCTEIAILKATALRLDAMKISAIIGGVLVVMAALLKVAGVL